MKFFNLSLALVVLMLFSCKSENTERTDASQIATTEQADTDIKFNDVSFSTIINPQKGEVTADGDTLLIFAEGNTDLFCDPLGKATALSSPQLCIEVDNTKPFTFSVKVTPQYDANDTYSAAGIVAYENPQSWQKLCYEQDEQGDHRIVTVRTIGDSDDNNHQIVNTPSVWLRMMSDGERVGNYWSEDGQHWHLVRIYKNIYPEKLTLSLTSQCPKGDGFMSKFTDLTLSETKMENVRGE